MSYQQLDERQQKRYWATIKQGIENGLNSIGILIELEKEFGCGFPASSVRRHVAKIRQTWGRKQELTKKVTATPGSVKVEGTGSESQEIELQADRVVTLEDALAKAGTDLAKWDVERYVVNSWEVGAKGPDGRVCVTPLWQVKVWLKAKKGWNHSEFKAILLKDMKALAPSYRQLPACKPSAPLLAELSIADSHWGKLCWGPETGGQDYDLTICRNRYMQAGRELLARSRDMGVERVLYVLGNDQLHTDHRGLTTNGTPQDCDGRWQKAFRMASQASITLAEEASTFAPVSVLVVPGNHDREKSFVLGEVMSARFHNHPSIEVLNTPDVYQYFRWGKVLLGFVHGDAHGSDRKQAELPLVMATDRPEDWACTVWREFHLGHFHSEREDVWKYRKVHHVRDMAVRILPSLSSTDAWHRQSGYCSVLAAECHVYHKERGRYSIMSSCFEG